MKNYRVLLSRGYSVLISAKSQNEAKEFAEYFIGGERDLSDELDRKKHNFSINEIKLTTNDAIDAEEYEEKVKNIFR